MMKFRGFTQPMDLIKLISSLSKHCGAYGNAIIHRARVITGRQALRLVQQPESGRESGPRAFTPSGYMKAATWVFEKDS